MSKETGGPAFPRLDCYVNADGSDPLYVTHGGMTLRDYFAAKAMQAYLPTAVDKGILENDIADCAYEYADAMLKAREA